MRAVVKGRMSAQKRSDGRADAEGFAEMAGYNLEGGGPTTRQVSVRLRRVLAVANAKWLYLCCAVRARRPVVELESSMLLTKAEGQHLIAPHHDALLRWHYGGYKEKLRLMTTMAGQWAVQDGTTQGTWTRNLVLDQARQDETERRRVVREGHLDLVNLYEPDGRPAARLRLRRVDLVTKWLGSAPQPTLPASSSDTAKEWIGNQHLYRSFTASLFDADREDQRLPTNLILGRTEDEVTGEFERLFVVCYIGEHVEWYYGVGAANESGGTIKSMPPGGPLPDKPRITPRQDAIAIRRKENGS